MTQQNNHQESAFPNKKHKGKVAGDIKITLVHPIAALNKTVLCFLVNSHDSEQKQVETLERMRQYCEKRGATTALHYYAASRPPLRLYAQVYNSHEVMHSIGKQTSKLGMTYSTTSFRSLSELPPDILDEEEKGVQANGEKGDVSA